MIITCCNQIPSSSFGINEIANIAKIIIAGLTLFLAFYIFVYQKSKDKNLELQSAMLLNKNIKLQWFKELIIQPKIHEVFNFYANVKEIKNKINSNELSDVDKIELINYVKLEHSTLRKSFLELLQYISIDLFKDLSNILDELTDSLTNSISNEELKLNNDKTYDREINSKIQNSYSQFMSMIFNYRG